MLTHLFIAYLVKKSVFFYPRHKIMAQMSKLQDKFAKGHAGELEDINVDSTPTPGSSQPGGGEGFFSSGQDQQGGAGAATKPAAAGCKRTKSANLDATRYAVSFHVESLTFFIQFLDNLLRS